VAADRVREGGGLPRGPGVNAGPPSNSPAGPSSNSPGDRTPDARVVQGHPWPVRRTQAGRRSQASAA